MCAWAEFRLTGPTSNFLRAAQPGLASTSRVCGSAAPRAMTQPLAVGLVWASNSSHRQVGPAAQVRQPPREWGAAWCGFAEARGPAVGQALPWYITLPLKTRLLLNQPHRHQRNHEVKRRRAHRRERRVRQPPPAHSCVRHQSGSSTGVEPF
jgi:hypothetical protein